MVTIRTIYTGSLRTQATHVRSGMTLVTDAPVDNNGKGESFSPTDLLAASLGSCMLTVIGIEAEKQGFTIDGTEVSILKIMATNPRMVSGIEVVLKFPDVHYTELQKQIIKQKGLTCPVALSLHQDIVQDVKFIFND